MDEEDERIFVLDDAARERLRRFIAEETPKIDARNAGLRAEGERARASGLPATSCPHLIGSYVSIRWLEGWSGTLAPERRYIPGRDFNMTPQQDVEQFTDWVMSLALPDDSAARAIGMCRAGYRPNALLPLN